MLYEVMSFSFHVGFLKLHLLVFNATTHIKERHNHVPILQQKYSKRHNVCKHVSTRSLLSLAANPTYGRCLRWAKGPSKRVIVCKMVLHPVPLTVKMKIIVRLLVGLGYTRYQSLWNITILYFAGLTQVLTLAQVMK